jgi:DNA-binding NarL/FixJ family response regulator
MIRVLIANDHTLMRAGLRHILEPTTGCHVVGEAADGTSALHLARNTTADVMLLELLMPGRNPFEVIQLLKHQQVPVRVIVLTLHAEYQYAQRAFRCGARGYLTKNSAKVELVTAIARVASGGVYVTGVIAEQLACNLNRDTDRLPHEQLSNREFDVFRRLANGETVSAIANQLCISCKTVSTYKMRIHQKMQTSSDAALVRYALENNLCDARMDCRSDI